MAIGLGGVTPAIAKADKNIQKLYADDLRELFKLGVPFVTAAGNEARSPAHREVDQLPMVLQDTDAPLIVGGASDWNGERAGFSQAGELVTLYAPGVDVECQSKHDGTSTTESGSSIAAPQVAGLIATYMSYGTKPWDDTKTGVERINAIKDYLVSKDSSWERQTNSGIRVIWNEATKDDHKHATTSSPDTSNTPEQPPNEPSDPAPPPPPPKTKTLSIIYQNIITTTGGETDSWLYFTTDYGVSALCLDGEDAAKSEEATEDTSGKVDSPPWPPGMELELHGLKCEYKREGDDAGSLSCNDGEADVKCKKEDRRDDKGYEECDIGVYRHPVVSCEW